MGFQVAHPVLSSSLWACLRAFKPACGHRLSPHPTAETLRPPWVYGRRGSSLCHHLVYTYVPNPADPDVCCQPGPEALQHGSSAGGTRFCDLSAKSETHQPNSSYMLRESNANHVCFTFSSVLKELWVPCIGQTFWVHQSAPHPWSQRTQKDTGWTDQTFISRIQL